VSGETCRRQTRCCALKCRLRVDIACDCSASGPECTRTSKKSCPKRRSISFRNAGSSGRRSRRVCVRRLRARPPSYRTPRRKAAVPAPGCHQDPHEAKPLKADQRRDPPCVRADRCSHRPRACAARPFDLHSSHLSRRLAIDVPQAHLRCSRTGRAGRHTLGKREGRRLGDIKALHRAAHVLRRCRAGAAI